jgi:hypothetical protein
MKIDNGKQNDNINENNKIKTKIITKKLKDHYNENVSKFRTSF